MVVFSSTYRQLCGCEFKIQEMTATKTWRDNRRDEPQGLIFSCHSHTTSFFQHSLFLSILLLCICLSCLLLFYGTFCITLLLISLVGLFLCKVLSDICTCDKGLNKKIKPETRKERHVLDLQYSLKTTLPMLYIMVYRCASCTGWGSHPNSC